MLCSIVSGDYEISLNASSLLAAAKRAISLHDIHNKTSKLGEWLLVSNDADEHDILVMRTRPLIEENTSQGYGNKYGQYSHVKDKNENF